MPSFFSSRNNDDTAGGGVSENNEPSATNDTNEEKKTEDDDGTRIGTATTKIRTFLLLHLFTALLPPTESKEELKSTEYYKILDLKKNATPEQIRKAYKQKSLALHPDKIAQRRNRYQRQQRQQQQQNGTNSAQDEEEEAPPLSPEEAAELFLKVQEAHAVLSNEHNRQVYHEMGCSPARYKFVHDTEEGGGAGAVAIQHPMMLYENLANASCMDKTRLVSVVTFFVLLCLVQPILICAKINQNLSGSGSLSTVPWSTILVPFWIFYGVIFMGIQLLLVVWVRNWQVRWFALQHLCWLIGIILVVQVWDGQRQVGGESGGTSWHALSTPFYLAIFCRVAGLAQTAKDLLHMVHSRMASLEHLQQTEPRPERRRPRSNENASATDTDEEEDDDFLTEEEWIAQLSEKYVIITPDPQIVEAHVVLWHEENEANDEDDNENNGDVLPEIPEEDLESIRIASSMEYQSAMEQVRLLQRAAGYFLVYGILMTALIAAKLTPTQLPNASWWAIFSPLWIYLGLQMIQALALCCCSGLAAGTDEEVIILATAAAAAAAAGDEENGDTENQQGTAAASAGAGASSSPNSSPDRFKDENSPSRKQRRQQKQAQRPTASVNYANPEGSMKMPETGDVRASDSAAAAAAATTTDENKPDDDASLTPSDEGFFGQKGAADPPGMTAEEIQQQESKATPVTASAGSGDGTGGGDNNDDGGDGIPPHHDFDEETFHRWQRAHAKAESSAMEAQAKGQYQCCVAIFQLIILCLIAGKLQDDYRPEEEQPQAVGYNAFWIMFPIFFLAGILLCCCSCLIYSAGSASGLDDLVERQKAQADGDDNENDTNAANQSSGNAPTEEADSAPSTTIPLAAPAAATTTTSTQGESSSGKTTTATSQPLTTATTGVAPSSGEDIELGAENIDEGGMDDLD